jgi:hypothetical protein
MGSVEVETVLKTVISDVEDDVKKLVPKEL